jgi:hypothetical protein
MGVTRPCTGAWCTTSYQRYPTALSLACKSIIGTLDAGPDGHCEREDHQPLALFYSDLNSSLMVQGLAKLIATLGKDLSDCWHETRLFITEHRENRPLELLERSQERLESRLILLSQPATA